MGRGTARSAVEGQSAPSATPPHFARSPSPSPSATGRISVPACTGWKKAAVSIRPPTTSGGGPDRHLHLLFEQGPRGRIAPARPAAGGRLRCVLGPVDAGGARLGQLDPRPAYRREAGDRALDQ